MNYDDDYNNNEEFLDVSVDEILEMYTNIENENKQLYEYIAKLENRVNESGNANSQTDSNSESLLREKDNEIARLEDEIADLKENSSNNNSDIVQNLENELNKKIDEIKSLKNKIRELEENSYGGYSDDEESELLKSKNAELKEKLAELHSENSNLKNEIANLRENGASNSEKSGSNNLDIIQNLENELNKKINDIKSLKNKIRELEENSYGGYSDDEEVDLLKSKNADLKEKLSALREENELLKKNSNNQNNDIDTINNEKLEELMAEINSLKQDNARLKSENNRLKGDSTASSDNSELESTLNEKNIEIKKLKDKLADINNSSDKLAEKDNEINKLKTRNTELEEEIKNNSNNMNKSNDLLVELSAKVNKLEQEKSELSQKTEKLEAQLRTVIAESMKKSPVQAAASQQISNTAPVTETPSASQEMDTISAQYIEQVYNDYINKKINNLPEAFNPIKLACRGIQPRIDDNNGIPFYYVDTGSKIYLYPDISIISSKNIAQYNYKVYNCSFEGKARLIKPAVITAPNNRGFVSVQEMGQLKY